MNLIVWIVDLIFFIFLLSFSLCCKFGGPNIYSICEFWLVKFCLHMFFKIENCVLQYLLIIIYLFKFSMRYVLF